MRVQGNLCKAVSPIVASLLLAGCAAAPPREIRSPCSASALLLEYAAAERLGPDQLDAAFARAKGAFERSRDNCDRLRVALLTLLEGSRRNEAYALRILGESADTGGDARAAAGDAPASLARLVGRALRERADADARAKAALRKASDDQNRVDAALKKASDDQNRADACKRQLDELRNVEKIIDERGTQ